MFQIDMEDALSGGPAAPTNERHTQKSVTGLGVRFNAPQAHETGDGDVASPFVYESCTRKQRCLADALFRLSCRRPGSANQEIMSPLL